MKAKECTVIVNTKAGYYTALFNAKSIREGIRMAKECCGFSYRIFVNGNLIKRGLCHQQ